MNVKSNIITIEPNSKLSESFSENVNTLFKLSGKKYFRELVLFLCNNTNSKYAFVGMYNSENKNVVVQSFYANSTYIKNFEYAIKGSPSEYVINNNLCVCFDKVQKEFPKDKGIKIFDVDGYVGIPLFDLTNKPIGIVVVMSQNPIQDVRVYKQLLKSIQSKTELEIERLHLKKSLLLSKKEFVNNFQNAFEVSFSFNFNKKGKQISQLISPIIEKVLGYNQEEIKTVNFIDFFKNYREAEAFLKLMKEKRAVENYPLTFVNQKGSITYVEIDCVLTDQGLPEKFSFQLIGKFKDVSKKTKQNLRIEIAYLIAEKAQQRHVDLNSFCHFIYQTIKVRINVPNFYIVVLKGDQLDFPFFKDKGCPYENSSFTKPTKPNGFIEYIINKKTIISLRKKEVKKLIETKQLCFEGEIPENLICFPLKSNSASISAMVVHTYHQHVGFSLEDLEFVQFIAKQVGAIIDRKEWQTNLVKSEVYFRSLVENASEIIVVINGVGEIEYISGVSNKILAYKPQELIGFNLSNFPGLIELKEFIDDGNTKNKGRVIRVVDQNGQEKYLDVHLSKMKENHGKIVINAKDITQRVLSDKKKEFKQKRLSIIHEIEKALISHKPLSSVLNDVLKIIEKRVLSIDTVFISQINNSKKIMKVLASVRKSENDSKAEIGDVIPFSELPGLRSILNKNIYNIGDIQKKKVLKEFDKKNIEEGVQSYLIIPIVANNKVIGSFYMGSKHKNYFKDIDSRIFKEIIRLLAVVINEFLLKKELAGREIDLLTILNSSNEGVLRVGISGKIMVVNDKLSEILAYTQKDFFNKKATDFVHEADIKKYNTSYNKILENKLEKVTVDIKFWSKKGVIIDCKVTMRSIFDVEGTLDYIIMFIEDKTEERAALNKVLNLENALNYSCSVLFTDKNSIITDVNEKALEYTGYTREELVGKPMKILSSDYYIKAEREAFWKTIHSGKIWQGELRNKKKDGSYYWLFTNVIPIISKDKEFEKNVIISFNITDDKVEKNALIREVIEAQEHERERFAMEIHDGLGQMLLASKMNLTAISDLDNLDNEMKEVLDTSVDLLVASIQEARSISHGLMSRVLNRFGIAYAVDEIINNINITSKLIFSFKHNIENIRFSEDLEMGIYRTLQELIKNVIRHSEATKAYVKITTSKNDLFLEIKDNGIGISNKLINSSKGGIGLRNMKSRIAYLGGVFEIDDSVKKGTKINIRISL
ncbi:MAG: hypothetical protein COB15_11690 [Flavobacteriales bacterium]|nr:MAG: hypothetical protein COB15_11690 [Flavobacteriales bacterium]